MSEWMNEDSMDTREVRAGGLGKVSFHFYIPKITFPMAQTDITEAVELEISGSRFM